MPRLIRTRSTSKLASSDDFENDFNIPASFLAPLLPRASSTISTPASSTVSLPEIHVPFHVSTSSSMPPQRSVAPGSPDPRRQLPNPNTDLYYQPTPTKRRDSHILVNTSVANHTMSLPRQSSERLRPKPTPLHEVVVTSSLILNAFVPPRARALSRPSPMPTTSNDSTSSENMASPPITHSEHSFNRQSDRFIDAQTISTASVRP